MKKQPFFVKLICLSILTLLIEFCLSNNIGDLLSPAPKTILDLSTAVCGGGVLLTDQSLEFSQKASAEFTLPEPVESQNLFLRLEGLSPSYVNGTISIADESRINNYATINEFSCNPGGKHTKVELPLHSNGKLLKLKIEITDDISGSVYLREAVLNHHKIHFQFVRWFILACLTGLLYCIHCFHLFDMFYDVKNKKMNLATAMLWLLNIGIAVFLLQYAKVPQEPVTYPLEKELTEYSIMVQQFDALQKGQLELDFPKDISYFEDTDNLYDTTQRRNGENFGSPYWDHVYYNGKFYSYFGLAPILVFYYPYYWINGTLPTDAATSFFFTVLAITFSFLLIRKYITCFHIKAGMLDIFLAFLALPAASNLFLIQSSADFYYIPYSAAIAFLLLFLYTSLAAYENRTTRRGILWYVAAGLSLGLSAASRPTTIIPIFLFILPLYFHVLRDKEITNVQKGKLVGGFSLPVCIIAALMMWYNGARFGSPFDFGVSHQITVSDIHYNHLSISLSRIVANLHQYWFLPLNLSERFPFFRFNYTASNIHGIFTWVGYSNLAVFAIPLNFALLLLPVLIRSYKLLYQKAMLIVGFIGGFLILYIDFCMGGVNIRYACDASLLFAILSLMTLCFLLKLLREYHLKQLLYAGHLLILVSIFIEWMLLFVNERSYIQNYAPDIFLSIKQFFTVMG